MLLGLMAKKYLSADDIQSRGAQGLLHTILMEGVWGSRNSVSKNWLIPIIFPPFFSLPVNFFCLSKICSFLSLKLEENHSIWEGLYRGAMKPQRRQFSLAWLFRYNSAVVLPFSWNQQHKNVYSPLWIVLETKLVPYFPNFLTIKKPRLEIKMFWIHFASDTS